MTKWKKKNHAQNNVKVIKLTRIPYKWGLYRWLWKCAHRGEGWFCSESFDSFAANAKPHSYKLLPHYPFQVLCFFFFCFLSFPLCCCPFLVTGIITRKKRCQSTLKTLINYSTIHHLPPTDIIINIYFYLSLASLFFLSLIWILFSWHFPFKKGLLFEFIQGTMSTRW